MTGKPCDGKERGTASPGERVRIDFHVTSTKPWKFIWCRTGVWMTRFVSVLCFSVFSTIFFSVQYRKQAIKGVTFLERLSVKKYCILESLRR